MLLLEYRAEQGLCSWLVHGKIIGGAPPTKGNENHSNCDRCCSAMSAAVQPAVVAYATRKEKCLTTILCCSAMISYNIDNISTLTKIISIVVIKFKSSFFPYPSRSPYLFFLSLPHFLFTSSFPLSFSFFRTTTMA